MPTNINFDKKLGFINGTSIVLPSGPGADFSTRSLSFDGIDDYISTSEVYSELDGQTTMTFSAWIKPTSATTSVIASVQDNGSAEQFRVIFHSSRYIIIRTFTGNGRDTRTANASIDLNIWTHIAFCLDYSLSSGSRGKIFINGVDATSSDSQNQASLNTSGGALYIGARNISLGSRLPFAGLLDEIAIWSGQDLRNDVATIWNNGKPADLTSLNPTSWYRAGENSTFAYPQILMPEDTNKDKVSKYSLDFDGTSDYISIGTNSLGITDSITVSAWVKIPTTNTGGGGTNIQVIACEDTTSGGQRNWNMFWRGTGSNYFAWAIHHTNLSFSSVVTSGITPNDGQWHHLLGTYDGTTNANGIKLYVDGVLSVQGTAGSTGINAFSSSEPTIGATTGGGAWRFEGNIDEVAVWSDDLSASANAIYNGGIPTDIASLYPTRLEGYWKLGEEAKFTNTWLVPNSALSNFSKYSFNFDGVDDYVEVANNTTIARTQNISYSIWVNLVDGTARQYLVGNWNSSNGGTGLAIETSNILVFQLGDGTNDSYFNSRVTNFTTYAPNNTWNHILATWDGTDAKIYINGTLRNTWTPTSLTISNWSTFHIARRGATTVNNLTNGKLDEIALWDSGLSAAAVTAIYNGGKPKDLSGNSPISWWRMGEEATYNSGTSQFTIPDQGSESNNGTSSNTMLLETLVGDAPQYYGGGISDSMDIFDRVGDAPVFTNNFSLDFDGIDDYVNCGNDSSLNLTSQITWSAWVKFNALNDAVNYGIVSNFDPNEGYKYTFIYYPSTTSSSRKLRLRINSSSGSLSGYYDTSVDLSDNQWHHVAFSFDGTTNANGIKVYVDGVNVNSFTASNAGIFSSSGSTLIGAYQTAAWFANANIDEVSVFNTELSASDVTSIYNSGVPNDISSLSPVSWWRFEEGSGTTAIDSGSGGNDGTLTNGPLYDTDRILTPKANNTVSFNMEEADIVEDTP